jgi:leader peptidase (prepilin peptidase)/N-methyltransferase
MVLLGWDPLLAGKELGVASAIAAGVGAPLVLLLTDRLFGGALGMGDVKLAVSLGLMLGVTRLLTGFLVATIAGALILLVLMALGRLGRRSPVPFGPILIGAAVVGMLLP